MLNISPVVTVNANPGVSVTTNPGAPTYEQMRGLLGYYVFDAYQLYLSSATMAQVQQVYGFNKYDMNGNAQTHQLTPVFSPYQYRNTVFYDIRDRPVIIDGRNSFDFYMLPNASMQFKIYSVENSVGRVLQSSDFPVANTFAQLESATGLHGFFEEFRKQIPLKDPTNKDLSLSMLNFTIANNTSGKVQMSFLGNLGNRMDISNQYIQYSYLMPIYLGPVTSVSIQYRNRSTGGPYFTASTSNIPGPYSSDIVTALNTLNVGTFYFVDGGSVGYNITYNDNLEYNILTISP